MHTLVLVVNGIKKEWLLNTNVSPDVTDALVNKIIDSNNPEDWWIDEDWQDPLMLKKPLLVKESI
tara:strand:- start:596 stop:790 length:195 start_codon:yes stop_codon:yes gene_type:complete